MKTWIAAAALALIVGSAAAQEQPLLSGPPTPAQFEWAREALDAKLFDYPTARFRDVHADRRRICGWVNSKNRMGAYAGWQRFLVMGIEDSEAHFSDDDRIGMIGMLCDDDPVPAETDYSDRLTVRQ